MEAQPQRKTGAQRAGAVEPPAWQLVVHLDYGRQRRTVTLDYVERTMLDAQLSQLARKPSDPYHLFEFRNERGETLAVLARAFLRYDVVALP